MHMYNITTYYGVKYLFHNTFFGSSWSTLVQCVLVELSFDRVVFWSSYRLVKLVLVELSVVELSDYLSGGMSRPDRGLLFTQHGFESQISVEKFALSCYPASGGGRGVPTHIWSPGKAS
jgi:hypothetical protein